MSQTLNMPPSGGVNEACVRVDTAVVPGAEAVSAGASDIDSRYARYVLSVLVLVYVINFIDRQIFAILAEEIKADLGLSDGDLGFLFGTAFAIFYAVFGIPLGRLADVWNRKKLISAGLAFWSGMTALSGLATGFGTLAACRIGIGVGEASASPAAHTLLYDYFSPKVRTTVLAIYGSGLYIGAGIGLFLGGLILETWISYFPDPALAPFGLKGWQVAFFAVGLPGLLMAVWVSTLREPVRGLSDGLVAPSHPHPFREAFVELAAILPLSSLWNLQRLGAKVGAAKHAILINLSAGLGIGLVAFLLMVLSGDILQWVSMGVGFYCIFSWSQGLYYRDRVAFGMLFQCKSVVYLLTASSLVVFLQAGIGFWAIPYYLRAHQVGVSELGLAIGLIAAVSGFLGVLMGGLLADLLRRHTSKGKLYVQLTSIVLSPPAILLFLCSEQLVWAYVGSFLITMTASMGMGPVTSTLADLVLPRTRAMTSAFSIMISTILGAALGPYCMGMLSDSIAATGVDSGESLRQAMLWSLLLGAAAIGFSLLAVKHISGDELSRLDRARRLGEPGLNGLTTEG